MVRIIPLATYEKDPDASKVYTIDWAKSGPNDGTANDDGWLQGDTIATSTWIVPSGLTSEAESNTGTLATIKLSGGVMGRNYFVTNRITTTTSGETEDRSIEIRIVPK